MSLHQNNNASKARTLLSICQHQINLESNSAEIVDANYFSSFQIIINQQVDLYGGTRLIDSGANKQYEFSESIQALNCAVNIQSSLDLLNEHYVKGSIYLLAMGIDLVSKEGALAKFLSDSASPGEIYLSESVYWQVEGKTNIFCRFSQQLSFNKEGYGANIYEAFWVPSEVEIGQSRLEVAAGIDPHAQPARSFGLKLIISIMIALAIILVLMAGYRPVLRLISQTFSR